MLHQTLANYGNLLTALAYYVITLQILFFARSSKILSLFKSRGVNDQKKQELYYVMMALVVLFSSFICLCGNTHAFHILVEEYPDSVVLKRWQSSMLTACAIVSVVTAVGGFKLFPILLQSVEKFELNDEGCLEHAENYLLEVITMVKESIVVFSDRYKIIRGNEASKALFGKQLVGLTITDRIHPDDVLIFESTVQRVANSYAFAPTTIDYRIKAVSGGTNSTLDGLQLRHDDDGEEVEYVWIESTICKGQEWSPSHSITYDLKMISRNVDNRKKQAQYKEILRAAREQEQANIAKLRYISCVAHDLKTPLQSFCFTLDLLLHTSLTADQKDLVSQANVAVDLMKLTISQTMDISKAITGVKLQPRRGPLLLSSVVHRVSIIINGYGKQVNVDYEVDANIVDNIITDEEWLWQMLLNLLTNACKYTDKGSIKMRVSLRQEPAQPPPKASAWALSPSPLVPMLSIGKTIAFETPPVQLLFEVIDTGVGVREDSLDKIFDAFAQVQEGQVTGTGLGLYGVRMRAEGLQGTCGARHNTESCTGTGTVIWFAIPYVMADRSAGNSPRLPAPPTELPPPPETSSNVKKTVDTAPPAAPCKAVSSPKEAIGRIRQQIAERRLGAMVIDDTLTIRKLMEKMLLQMGFAKITCYENGSKGLDAMIAEPVDIVFSDVQMPIMTGPEMINRYRKWEATALQSGTRQVRQLVVAVTANGAECSTLGDSGFDFVLPKPLDKNELYRIILGYMNGQDGTSNV